MTKKNSTKRALISSLLILAMCFTMLVGTTFAWFTDSVTSAGNKIVAGKLDIQLWKYDGTNYVDISNSTAPIFQSANQANPTNATLWEPGKTQVAYLKIKNNGSLWLKYQVALIVTNVKKNLDDVMLYKIVPASAPNGVPGWDATGANYVADNTTDEAYLAPEQEYNFALVIHMDENAGNEYMDGEIDFDITVLATQYNHEEDSFGPDYDKFAIFPEVATVTVPAGTTEASSITAGGITVVLPANNDTGATDNVYRLDVSNADTTTDETTGETEVEFDATLYLNNAKVVSTAEGHVYEMTLTIPAGAELASVKHNGAPLTESYSKADQTYTYDSATGVITIYTKSFSPFSVSYSNVIRTEEELAAFFAGDVSTGVLGDDITSSDTYTVRSGKKVLYFAGHSIAECQIKVPTGVTLGLLGKGSLTNATKSPLIVNGGTLDLGISVSATNSDALTVEDAASTVILDGASIEAGGDPFYATAPCTLIVADDTTNTLKTTYTGYGAAAMRLLAYENFADSNDEVFFAIKGQTKGNGKLTTVSGGYGIQLYGADANVNATLEHFDADICGGDTAIYTGVYNSMLINNITGGFSDDQSAYCPTGYFTKFDSETGKYLYSVLTEGDAVARVTNGDEVLFTSNFVQAVLLAKDNATVTLLKNVDNTYMFERVTAEHITIDLNGKLLTSSESIGINRNSSFNANVCAPIYVTFTNGSIDADIRFEENANVVFNNVQFVNSSNSMKKIMVYSDLNRNIYAEAAPSYQSAKFNNCTFNNYYFEFTGRNEAQRIDVEFNECTLNKTINSYYSLIKYGDNYGYGLLTISNSTLNAYLNNSYNYGVEINTYASYIGDNTIALNLNNAIINVTGSSTKPVSAGTWTVNEIGTNTYTVAGVEKNYDGTALS